MIMGRRVHRYGKGRSYWDSFVLHPLFEVRDSPQYRIGDFILMGGEMPFRIGEVVGKTETEGKAVCRPVTKEEMDTMLNYELLFLP
jgi:hypothetical protein